MALIEQRCIFYYNSRERPRPGFTCRRAVGFGKEMRELMANSMVVESNFPEFSSRG